MHALRCLCHPSAITLIPAIVVFGISRLPAGEPRQNVPPEGFVALFSGADLSGWKGLVGNPKSRAAMSADELSADQARADESMRAHWSVVDGVLVFDGRGENLCTVDEYENFELYVDWKIQPGGDSGIYLRGVPQVQIWDPLDGSRDRVGSGGLFNNQTHPDEPLVRADRLAGEWNTFYIMLMGESVSVKLNGKLVVDDVVLENYWDRAAPLSRRGPIELQSHGSPLAFRNIFLRELPPAPSPPWQVLFDGTDLDRWDVPERGWRIDEGTLTVSRRRSNPDGDNTIWTKDRFGDFILDLEFMISAGGDSGIFLRTDDREDRVQTGLEIQICDSPGLGEISNHDCGAVYDVMPPRFNAARPPEEWNHVTIVAQDSLVSVVLNKQRIIDLDLNLWTQPRQNLDGSTNMVDTPLRDLKRAGFVGFQHGGQPVSFRNVRIKRLD